MYYLALVRALANSDGFCTFMLSCFYFLFYPGSYQILWTIDQAIYDTTSADIANSKFSQILITLGL